MCFMCHAGGQEKQISVNNSTVNVYVCQEISDDDVMRRRQDVFLHSSPLLHYVHSQSMYLFFSFFAQVAPIPSLGNQLVVVITGIQCIGKCLVFGKPMRSDNLE